MKKTIILSFLTVCLFALNTSAQTTKPKDSIPVFSIADSANFTGRYRYEGLPFEYMEISVKGGSLSYSGGEYNGTLSQVKGQKDVFDANGKALFTFIRNGDNKVTDMKIDYMGQSYVGKKEEKKE
jgi:hypothetical protein